MTVPKDRLKKKAKKYKRREKKYKPKGWYIGGPHSIHPGLDFAAGVGEVKNLGLLDVEDWDDISDAVKNAMVYRLMSERQMRTLIRDVLTKTQNERYPKELHIFDFDGTLVDTPMPIEGKRQWEEVTGEPWPYRGWWNRPESMDLSVFDIHPISWVLADFHKSIMDPDAYVIVMTGRNRELVAEVSTILVKNGINPDELKLTPGGISTLFYKQNVIRKLARTMPLEKIVIWEDRIEHATAFEKMGLKLGLDVVVNRV